MKSFFLPLLLIVSLCGCDIAYAKEKIDRVKDSPRLTTLTQKKRGADDLAARAKNANNVAQLKLIVLELIELETGGK